MIELIGYISAGLLASCGVPLLWGSRLGTRTFLWFWFLGEVGMMYYVILLAESARDLGRPLFLNYAFNTLLVGYLLARKNRRGS